MRHCGQRWVDYFRKNAPLEGLSLGTRLVMAQAPCPALRSVQSVAYRMVSIIRQGDGEPFCPSGEVH